MPKFEIAVHNAAVRERLAEGLQHRQLSDEWGDTRFIEIKAPDEDAAWSKARSLYGESNGYVIEAVTEIHED